MGLSSSATKPLCSCREYSWRMRLSADSLTVYRRQSRRRNPQLPPGIPCPSHSPHSVQSAFSAYFFHQAGEAVLSGQGQDAGGNRGAAVADRGGAEQHGVQPRLGEAQGAESSRDTAAHHGHVTGDIGIQPGILRGGGIRIGPQGRFDDLFYHSFSILSIRVQTPLVYVIGSALCAADDFFSHKRQKRRGTYPRRFRCQSLCSMISCRSRKNREMHQIPASATIV